MRTKTGTKLHSKGNLLHFAGTPTPRTAYASAVAAALRHEARSSNHGAKIFMRWTGASERAVKGWITGQRGPSGAHLVSLMANSEAVLSAVLNLAGRERQGSSADIERVREHLCNVLRMLGP